MSSFEPIVETGLEKFMEYGGELGDILVLS
jgi:hypothetical protein